ncbi:MAG: cysteine desulfurase NifS [Tissierellales bacterium]|nr:cysteine desulfurase NifS [Tissierellales bacterium]
MKRIYMDHAATTPVRKDVLDTMMPYFTEKFGNASSIYVGTGQEARIALDESREKIASILNVNAKEVYFTSGGSEADNWAIKGIAFANKNKGNHIITSKVEHHAILHTCEYLEKHGFEVTYVDVDSDGLVNPKDIEAAIKENTILISVMYANNEVGTIQPIKEIAEIAKKHKIYCHTDAVQALGNLKVDFKELGVDAASMSAHKVYGPKGVGALYLRRGVKIDNLIHGGAQEFRKRATTENVAGIVGFAKALEIAYETLDKHVEHLEKMRERLIEQIEANIPYVKLNGHRTKRLPGNVNFSIEYIEGEAILLSLDMMGIIASSGSACTSGSLDPSHVLLAMGLPHEIAHGSLRLSLGESNSIEDIDYTVEELAKIVKRLRDMSPLYEGK